MARLGVNIHPEANNILRRKARGSGPLGKIISELIFRCDDWDEILQEIQDERDEVKEERRKRDRHRKRKVS